MVSPCSNSLKVKNRAIDTCLTLLRRFSQHANSKTALQLRFSLPSIIITITGNETLKQKNTQYGSKSTNHKSQTMTF